MPNMIPACFQKSIVFALTFLSLQHTFSQKVTEGFFNNWHYSPTGVHGNLSLKKVKGRSFFEIQKNDQQSVTIKQYNPAGIIINLTTLNFKDGFLSDLNEANQWGDKYEYKSFTKLNNDEFIVTDYTRGVNDYLPCKYAKFIYKEDLLTEIRYYSYTGKLADNKNGVAIIRYKRFTDSILFAEEKEMAFFNSEDLPALSTATGFQKVTYDYDTRDNIITTSYFDINGAPITTPGVGAATVRDYFNEDNNYIKTEYYGRDGKLTTNINGFSIREDKYLNGYSVEQMICDATGTITRGNENGPGGAIIKKEYDSAGNNTRRNNFDENDKPLLYRSEVHEIVDTYSSANMLIKRSFFDTSGNPVTYNKNGHTLVYGRDSTGRLTSLSFFGIDNRPVKSYNDEVFMLKNKFDEYGRTVEVSYWLDSITPMANWTGAHGSRSTFNREGQQTKGSSFDEEGNPFRGSDSTSSFNFFYNDEGRMMERQFLYKDTLTIRQRGITRNYSVIKYAYNKNGKVSDLTFFDDNLKPVNAVIGLEEDISAHRIEFIYKGRKVVEQLLYEAGNNIPVKKIDCLKNKFIATTGIHDGRNYGN